MQVLGAAGEFPSLNELTAPPGAAKEAVNVVVDLDAYLTHPGLTQSASMGPIISSFTTYRDAIVAHSEDDATMWRLQSGAWTQIPGTYSAPSGELMAFQEAQGSLFFTTNAGLFRFDGLTTTPVLSGLPQATPGTAALSGGSGFLDDGEATAYRWNWAVNVDDGGTGRLVQGAPSPLLVVSNSAGGSRDVALTIPIPENLPAGAFLQVYRADSVPNTITPTNEVRQVYEREPNAAETAAMSLSFTDATPDTVKGSGAYFASNTGEGIPGSNYQAALAIGLSKFAESVFEVGVSGVHRIDLTLLGVETVDIGIILTRGAVTETYSGAPTEAFPGQFKVFTGGTPAQNLAQTIESLARAINSRAGGFAMAFGIDTDGTRPGAILIQARDVLNDPIHVKALYNGNQWAPALPARAFGISISRTLNVVTVTTDNDHSFTVGEEVNLFFTDPGTDANFPFGNKIVASVPTPDSFTYAEVGADAVGTEDVYSFESVSRDVTTETGTAANAVAWSKRLEPDHWPLTNLNTVGGSEDEVLWGQPLDRFFFLGSEAGLFRVQGNADEGFDFGEGVWDSSVRFLGRRTVAALDGRAYALASEGLVSWTEGSKPKAVDVPIQDELRARIRAFPETVAEYAFLVADGVNHRLYVAMPTASTDTSAKVVHVLNLAGGGAWTRLDATFPGFGSGISYGTAPATAAGLAYFTAEASPYILTTRQTETAADFQGPSGEAIPSSVTFLPLLAGEPERQKQWTWTRIFTKAPTTAIEFCYASDWMPSLECQSLPEMDPITAPVDVVEPVRAQAWKTIVGRDRQRSRALTVKIGHATAQERFRLLGFEIKHRAYGSGQ